MHIRFVEMLKNNTTSPMAIIPDLKFDTPEKEQEFIKAFGANISTQSLHLTSINSETCQVLSNVMIENQTINKLCLSNFNAATGDPSLIIKTASTRLTYLDLFQISNERIPDIMRAISLKNSIREITIRFFKTNALTTLFNHLDQCPNITKITLSSPDQSTIDCVIKHFNKRQNPIELNIDSPPPFSGVYSLIAGIVNERILITGANPPTSKFISELKEAFSVKKITARPQPSFLAAASKTDANNLNTDSLGKKRKELDLDDDDETIDLNKKPKFNTSISDLYDVITIAILRTENEFLKNQADRNLETTNNLQLLLKTMAAKTPQKVASAFTFVSSIGSNPLRLRIKKITHPNMPPKESNPIIQPPHEIIAPNPPPVPTSTIKMPAPPSLNSRMTTPVGAQAPLIMPSSPVLAAISKVVVTPTSDASLASSFDQKK